MPRLRLDECGEGAVGRPSLSVEKIGDTQADVAVPRQLRIGEIVSSTSRAVFDQTSSADKYRSAVLGILSNSLSQSK